MNLFQLGQVIETANRRGGMLRNARGGNRLTGHVQQAAQSISESSSPSVPISGMKHNMEPTQ